MNEWLMNSHSCLFIAFNADRKMFGRFPPLPILGRGQLCRATQTANTCAPYATQRGTVVARPPRPVNVHLVCSVQNFPKTVPSLAFIAELLISFRVVFRCLAEIAFYFSVESLVVCTRK